METILEILLTLKEEEMEVIEEDTEEIEEAEVVLEEIEVTKEDLEEIEEIEVTEVMVTLKEEMKGKMVDGIKEIPTGKMMLLNQLNSTMILEMIILSLKKLKILNSLNQLMKEPAQHIQEILN